MRSRPFQCNKLSFLGLLLIFSQLTFSQKKKDIKTLEVKVSNVDHLSPGTKIPIGAKIETYGGKEKSTKQVFGGNLSWSKLKVSVTGGRFEKGYLVVEPNIQKIKDHLVMLVVSDPKNRKIQVTKTFKLNFKGPQVCDISGEVGKAGSEGKHGTDGSKTEDGNGLSGSSGSTGQEGGLGKSATVKIKAVQLDSVNIFLKIQVEDLITKVQQRFLVNVDGGSLLINASGGIGGEGGQGGDGGTGRDQKDDQTPGKGGNGGDGGRGGDGGPGGTLLVYYDSTSAPYLDKIEFLVNGGKGGDGGRRGTRGQGGKELEDSRSEAEKFLLGSGETRGDRGKNGEDGQEGTPGEVNKFLEEYLEVDF